MAEKDLQITNHDFLIYRDSNNDVKVSVMLINNDIWLTQNLIAELFGVGRSTITEHINNILNSGELTENSTVGKADVDHSKKPVKIYNRVDAEKEHMGLTNWKNSPDGPIYRYDVDIAKNYLNEKELKDLNRIVTMYLDYAELQAENHNAMTMKDWIEKLNVFLQFNGKEILHNAGKISAKVAQELAYREYDKFKVKQDKLYKSDFDLLLEEIDK